jgi:hypothetical protein
MMNGHSFFLELVMFTEMISEFKTVQEKLSGVPDRARQAPDLLRARGETAIEEIRSSATTKRNQATAALYAFEQSALELADEAVERAAGLPLFDRVAKNVEDLLMTARESVMAPAMADYDTLNVKQVNAALSGLSYMELLKVASYESANKNRKTVLGAVNGLL